MADRTRPNVDHSEAHRCGSKTQLDCSVGIDGKRGPFHTPLLRLPLCRDVRLPDDSAGPLSPKVAGRCNNCDGIDRCALVRSSAATGQRLAHHQRMAEYATSSVGSNIRLREICIVACVGFLLLGRPCNRRSVSEIDLYRAWNRTGREGSPATFAGPRLLAWLCLAAGVGGPILLDILQNTYTANVPRYASGALAAAVLITGFALAQLPGRPRAALLLLILVCWLSTALDFRRHAGRSGMPYRAIDGIIRQNHRENDLVIVHSIPSGVLGIARYMPIEIPTVPWVGQLRQRRVPQDVERFIAGRERVILVKIHTVGEPAPEEGWLLERSRLGFTRTHCADSIEIFVPLSGQTF